MKTFVISGLSLIPVSVCVVLYSIQMNRLIDSLQRKIILRLKTIIFHIFQFELEYSFINIKYLNFISIILNLFDIDFMMNDKKIIFKLAKIDELIVSRYTTTNIAWIKRGTNLYLKSTNIKSLDVIYE